VNPPAGESACRWIRLPVNPQAGQPPINILLMWANVQNLVKIGQTVWRYHDILFKGGGYLVRRVNVHHRTKFHQNRSNGCGDFAFNVFQSGGHLPSWICRAHFRTTHKEYLLIFITVHNMVGIAVVVSIVRKCEYFACLAWKCLFMHIFRLKMGDNGHFLHFYPSRNSMAQNWHCMKKRVNIGSV